MVEQFLAIFVFNIANSQITLQALSIPEVLETWEKEFNTVRIEQNSTPSTGKSLLPTEKPFCKCIIRDY
jgi:hypothetical protein